MLKLFITFGAGGLQRLAPQHPPVAVLAGSAFAT
jgi:hypothetical protein